MHVNDLSGLAGFTGAKDDGLEAVVTTGAARRAKLQSKCHQQQTNVQRFTGRMACCPTNSVEALMGRPKYGEHCMILKQQQR